MLLRRRHVPIQKTPSFAFPPEHLMREGPRFSWLSTILEPSTGGFSNCGRYLNGPVLATVTA